MIQQLDHSKVLSLLPERDLNGHKGSFGKLLLLCGSMGYTGAPALAAMGALRCGAGLVYLAVPESIYAIEAVKMTEPIIFPLADQDGKLAEAAISDIESLLRGKHAILIGPGLGISDGTSAVLSFVLQHYSGPIIIDADGITLLNKHKHLLRGRTSPTILTPHEGEFTRIGGKLTGDRAFDALQIAKELGAIVLLKGHNTIITDGEHTYINPTGNPGMATGGSGDVLAGIITALIGQGLPALEAAACGAWIHGAAGDICAKEIGQYGMLPSDMLNVLPRLLK